MNNLTLAQMAWLRKHPKYSPIGEPRPGVRFYQVGTCTATARSSHCRPSWRSSSAHCMSVLVGVAVKPTSELR
jgi:hypothetical protein